MTWQILGLRSIIQQAAYGLEKLSLKNKIGFLYFYQGKQNWTIKQQE